MRALEDYLERVISQVRHDEVIIKAIPGMVNTGIRGVDGVEFQFFHPTSGAKRSAIALGADLIEPDLKIFLIKEQHEILRQI